MIQVTVSRSRALGMDEKALREWIRVQAGWSANHEVHLYVESASRCSLSRTTLDASHTFPDGAWEGRLFGDDTDVRWVRRSADAEGAASYDAWSVRELRSAGNGEGALLVERHERPRRYYLAGVWTRIGRGNHGFVESRYPGKVFEYPVAVVAEGDRAYIEVHEYRAIRPQWESLSENEIGGALDTAMLVEHRFAGVSAGRD
jgi:hypothetical protein